jgi:hypothetical protein
LRVKSITMIKKNTWVCRLNYKIHQFFNLWPSKTLCKLVFWTFLSYTVTTGVSFWHLLRHRNSTSTSVILTLKSVCLRVKTTLLSIKTRPLSMKTKLLSMKTTLLLSYRVLEMTLLSALIKTHSKVSKRHSKCHFQHLIR